VPLAALDSTLEQHVGWLDTEMEDAQTVKVLQIPCHILGELGHLSQPQGILIRAVGRYLLRSVYIFASIPPATA
jgi:hypothetical protein